MKHRIHFIPACRWLIATILFGLSLGCASTRHRGPDPQSITIYPTEDTVLLHRSTDGASIDVTIVVRNNANATVQVDYGCGGPDAQRSTEHGSQSGRPHVSVTQSSPRYHRGIPSYSRSRYSAFPNQIGGRSLILELDALGPVSAPERFSGYRSLTRYGLDVADMDLAERASLAALVAQREMTKADQMNIADSVGFGHSGRALLQDTRQGQAVALAALDTAALVAVPLTQNGGPYQAMMENQIMSRLQYVRMYVGGVNRPAKPIRADRWYGMESDTTFPQPGRVTLVVSGNPSGLTFRQLATLRRLSSDYATRGLDIVFSTYTIGYFRNKVQPITKDELQKFQSWFMDYLHAPFVLAAEISQFGRLPDGRRRNTPMTNETNYHHGVGGALVGKDGTIGFVYPVSHLTEALYRRKIEEALEGNGG